MVTSIEEHPPTSAAPLRLQLSSEPGKHTLDGAWWPRSHDLDVELADLVDHFPRTSGQVYRALFSPPDWTTRPRSVRVGLGRGRIKTGSFPEDDTHVVVLAMSSRTSLRLLVVPPESPGGHAAMEAAAHPGNRLSAAALLADEHEPDGWDHEVLDHWVDEGSAWWPASAGPPSERT